jgi:hypothetical protein
MCKRRVEWFKQGVQDKHHSSAPPEGRAGVGYSEPRGWPISDNHSVIHDGTCPLRLYPGPRSTPQSHSSNKVTPNSLGLFCSPPERKVTTWSEEVVAHRESLPLVRNQSNILLNWNGNELWHIYWILTILLLISLELLKDIFILHTVSTNLSICRTLPYSS